MTGLIKAAAGHNVAGTALTTLTPQPHYGGQQFAREVFTPAGVYRDTQYATLEFPPLDNDEYGTVLGQLGISSAEFADITIQLPDDEDRDSTTRYNGRVIKQRRATWRYPLQRGPTFIVQIEGTAT